MRWDAKPRWERLKGFSLALNYTAEDRRRQERERDGEKRLKQQYTLSLLSSVSKQMSTRLFSLLQYKGLLTKHTRRHAHASSRANQCILESVISQGVFPCPRWVSKVTKPATEERISYFPASVLKPLFAFSPSFIASGVFAFLFAVADVSHNMQCSVTLIDLHILQQTEMFAFVLCDASVIL